MARSKFIKKAEANPKVKPNAKVNSSSVQAKSTVKSSVDNSKFESSDEECEAPPLVAEPRAPRKFRQRTRRLRHIKKAQKDVRLRFPKRVVHRIAHTALNPGQKLSKRALEAVHHYAEDRLLDLVNKMYRSALHRGCTTLKKKDVVFVIQNFENELASE